MTGVQTCALPILALLKEDVEIVKEDVDFLKEESEELKTDVRELRADVDILKIETEEIKLDVCVLKVAVRKLDGDVTRIGLVIENEIRINIKRVAEGHLDLSRNLQNAMKPNQEIELLAVRIGMVETAVEKLKSAGS